MNNIRLADANVGRRIRSIEGKENRMERTLILTLSSGISDEPIKEYLLHNEPEYLFG